MSARFNYQPRTAEQLAKRASGNNWIGWAKDEYATYTVKKENQIRILPPTWMNPTHYGLDVWVHFSVGPEKGTVICLWKMKGQACPICEAFVRAEASGQQNAFEFKPTRRVVTWMIDRVFEREKQEKKCYLWAMPATKVDAEIAIICKDKETGQLYYIDDPDHGYDIFFNKEGEQLQTQYKGFTVSRRESTVDQWYLDYITANPIPNTLLWRTYDEVKALFEGQPAQAVQTPTQDGSVINAVPSVASAPVPFVPEWTGTHCSLCQQPQYTTPTGWTCSQNHIEAPSQEELAPPPAAPAPVVQAAPAPPPQPVRAPAPVIPQPAPVVAAPAVHYVPPTPPQAAPAPNPVPAAVPAAPAPGATQNVSSLRARFSTGK